MNSIIDEMLAKYDVVTLDDRKNVMKEIIQEIVLCGLSRAGFFSKAAFYGGTALRIFYGLDRFSEDLDFSLKESDENFDLGSYFPLLQKEVESYGLRFSVEEKKKTLISMLKDHPEGIVVYASELKEPHAVLLTDYTEGVFYCADSDPGKNSGRIFLTETLIADGCVLKNQDAVINSLKKYWYIK